ncbi:MAG: peptide ABC transporter substrate-binding protein [Litorilinea sp.]
MQSTLSRRSFLQSVGMVSAGVAASSFLAACAPAGAPAAAPAVPGTEAESLVNALGVQLPADALALDQQVIRIGQSEVGGAYGHLMESLYNRAFGHAAGHETLTTLNTDLEVVGIGAESWEISEDGLYWDFKLREGMTFTNGDPVRAQDWAYTLRYSLSNNYDFAWFYFDIRNAAAVASGELPAEELGIEAIDDYTLRIHTDAPVPYLPSLGVWFTVAPENAWEDLGENWATDPARFVGSGPFRLTKFERDIEHLWELYPEYGGVRRPYITQISETLLPTGLPAYMAGDVQTYGISGQTPAAEIALIENNPVLNSEMNPGIATNTDYLGFNTTGAFPPLDDARVRLALCKSIDKAELVQQIFQGFSNPAWGILPNGFVNYRPEFADLDPNVYDPEAARALLAEAGYADGEGFPVYEMWVRQPTDRQLAFAQALQARWQENLGIQVEIRPADFQSFTSNLKEGAPMYYVGYALDYFDPATFLNVFRSTGRHPHVDTEWDEFYNAANSTLDPDERFELIAEAEQRLVESTAYFFLHSPFSVSLWPCNLQGEALEPNQDGFRFYGGGGPGCPHAYEGMYWTSSDCRADL